MSRTPLWAPTAPARLADGPAERAPAAAPTAQPGAPGAESALGHSRAVSRNVVAGAGMPGITSSTDMRAQGATGRAGGAVLARVAALHEEIAQAYRELGNDLADARKTRHLSTVETTTIPARLLTAAYLGEKLRVDARTIRQWRKRGAIPAGIVIGGVLRWSEPEIDAWIARGGRP